MVSWFRSGLPPHQTALAMLGAKAGQDVLFLGGSEPDVAAEVARVTGLNGRTVVAEASADARRRVEQAAARAGALVELVDTQSSGLPATSDTFDLVAITCAWNQIGAAVRSTLVDGAFERARPGGRVVIVIRGGRKPLVGKPPKVARAVADDAVALLGQAGWKAVRILAEVPGTSYIEGVKPRATAGT